MAAQRTSWILLIGYFGLISMEIVLAQPPMFSRRTGLNRSGPQARFRQPGMRRARPLTPRGPGMAPNVLFGSQFRGRGPGPRLAPNLQQRTSFRGRFSNRQEGFGQNEFSRALNFISGNQQSRQQSQRQPSSRGTLTSSEHQQDFAGTNQRFQRLQSRNMILREAHQPFHSSTRTGLSRDMPRGWRQPAVRPRGRITANPEVVRRGFMSRFTAGMGQTGQTSSINRHSNAQSSFVPRSRSTVFETPRQLVIRQQSTGSRTHLTERSPLFGQSNQPFQTAVSHSQTPLSLPDRKAGIQTHVRPARHRGIPVAVKQPVIQAVQQSVTRQQDAQVVSQSAVSQPRTIISSPLHTAASANSVLSSKATISQTAPVIPQQITTTAVKSEPTLEEDLQLISSISTLLQAAGSPIQISVPSVPGVQLQPGISAVQHPGSAAHGAGMVQLSGIMHPGMISPWMGGHLGSPRFQEMMFGDTTDPADILATTTVAPNVTVANISEPVLNTSIVTAAVKVPAPEQIPAPHEAGVTEISPTDKHKPQNSVKTEIKIDAKISKEVPVLKVEPLIDTLVEPLPSEGSKDKTSTKITGAETLLLGTKEIDVIKIVSEALIAASYPISLREALLKQLSNALPNAIPTKADSNADVLTQSVDIPVKDTTTSKHEDITTVQPVAEKDISAKIQIEEILPKDVPVNVDIVTDRLPTAADLGIVIKDMPIEPTTKSPKQIKIDTKPVVVVNKEGATTDVKIVTNVITNGKTEQKVTVQSKDNKNFVSKYKTTKSGEGVKVVTKPLASTDTGIVNELTVIPKLASAVKVDVKKELIKEPLLNKEIKAEVTIKETAKPASDLPNKPDNVSVDTVFKLPENIPKDSVLKKIDLASLAKELSLITNGTDITQYLSDPLFVKVLEDIVSQTLAGEAKGKGKKTTPKQKTTTTTTPKAMSTEEYEFELEDMTTTTAATSTSETINETTKAPK